MKKIMFNDKYGLTQAVLDKRKTMTRRMTKLYEVGEVVAIAQRYKDVPNLISKAVHYQGEECKSGWNNKMFVKAEYMPHHIRIISVKEELLQDISREDCLREGIYYDKDGGTSIGYPFSVPFYYTFTGAIGKNGNQLHWSTPIEAFSVLIDKVGKKGTWDSNPIIYAYEIELID